MDQSHMNDITVMRPIKEMWRKDNNLYITYADGNKETVCFTDAYTINQTITYPNQDCVIVEEVVHEMETVT